jgi:hypothetical protein
VVDVFFLFKKDKMEKADFSFIKAEMTRNFIINGYDAVSQLELWEWFKSYTLGENEGFMFNSNPNVTKIGNKMHQLPDSPGHSGSSFGFTMRHLHYIAQNGLDQYKIFMTSEN